jgi:hypothetical protein
MKKGDLLGRYLVFKVTPVLEAANICKSVGVFCTRKGKLLLDLVLKEANVDRR